MAITTVEVNDNSTRIEITDGQPEIIEAVARGPAGAAGPTGATGAAGAGVPIGGDAGDTLTKIDGTDYNAEWTDPNDSPTIKSLRETATNPAIAAGVLTLDCSAGNIFTVALNAAITSIIFSNVPSDAYAMTLVFTADGTPRSVTWPASVKWPSATAPTLTDTNGQEDFFVLATRDSGATWDAFVAGQDL